MLWLLLSIVALVAGLLAFRRRRNYEAAEDEPWRASLADADEPLDIEEVRRAEEEWLQEDGWTEADGEEPWL